MDNKVTLPPISDIFTTKEPQAMYRAAPGAYPYSPMYSYQYVNTPGYAVGAGYHTPLYRLYGSNYAGYAPAPGAGPRVESIPAAAWSSGTSPRASPLSGGAEGQTLRAAALPVLPAARAAELLLPEAERALPAATRTRPRNNLPKETTYILLKWLNDHLNHPYPNSFEKTQLMMLTGLNQQQLSNWFINARRRKIKQLRHGQKATSE